jgi:hypothetical protein
VKKLFAFIIALLISFSSFAQNWDSVVIVGGAIGTIVSSEYALYQSLVKRELKGWATKETGTSVKLENQCGIDTEFHIIGDYKRNYIMVGISNTSGEQVAMNFRKVKFVVNGTSERYPGYSYQVNDELVNNGWWILASIPLPQKSELATYDHMKVDIPVIKPGKKEVCHIVTEFQRTGHYPKEDQNYNVFDFSFDLGPSLSQSGNVRHLGDPDFIWAMSFNWYFTAKHGAGMAFQWEDGFDGSKGNPANGSIFSGDFHYVYRQFLSPKLSFNFEPGIGFQSYYSDYYCSNCRQDSDSTLMIDYRLMLQYVLTEWNIADINVMNFFVGGGLVQQYGFSGDTNGSRYGLLFRVGFGY